MSVYWPRVRQVAGRATLAALISAPAVLYAQHPTPAQQSNPAHTDLQSALARIQKRVATTVGAKSVPQTALVTVPKPPKPADSKAAPAKKPATNRPSAAATPRAKPATAPPAPPAAPKAPRIKLSWRTTLTWPAEIAPPPAPGSGRVNLTWK